MNFIEFKKQGHATQSPCIYAPQPYWDLIKIKHQNPVENTAHHVTFFGNEHNLSKESAAQNRFFFLLSQNTPVSWIFSIFEKEKLLELWINKLKFKNSN